MRYEAQTNIHEWWDFAPSIGVAWVLSASAKKAPKSVFRTGFGNLLRSLRTWKRSHGGPGQRYRTAAIRHSESRLFRHVACCLDSSRTGSTLDDRADQFDDELISDADRRRVGTPNCRTVQPSR